MNLIQQQLQFTASIRDPENNLLPEDVDSRRMNIYQELIYNNIEGFIASAFPVLREISNDNYWHGLVRKFVKYHHAQTPLFHKLPEEFLHYLQHTHETVADDPVFLNELAHYEWVELELTIATDELPLAAKPVDTLTLDRVVSLSPLVRIYNYAFKVHKIGPDYLPAAADDMPTWMLVYRDRNDEVNFMELNAVTGLLLEKISTSPDTPCRQLLVNLAEEISHPAPDTVIKGGQDILNDLYQRDVILINQ